MLIVVPDALLITVLSIALVLALCAALVLVIVAVRRPSNVPLLIAAGLVVAAMMVVAVAPLNVPLPVGLLIALIGVSLGVVGGNPTTRRILDLATHGEVREGVRGGILVYDSRSTDTDRMQEVLRGGTVIGYLERLAVVASLVAGYPEAIAIVVAIKGIGRFSELATPAARERFIVGTLASLLWAGLVGALVRLAIW
ncbi:hypothetical protein LQ938_05470 [Microbacterium sp. cx-55]|uniref:hypothetical protein n=1 Tax=unclassified Microbacterium TaxID=2609290 RepID=UPI001CC0D29F|nr:MULTISPECIES: hypothetical protein [unclassified Microbacterium]MBZ4488663.1 hypothetical protein [Microbacterium sp. cx-55]MCC4909803.1 hypothetical protein [Microbacterium sp. cx-59]UGB36237.1 hypothetical protein LQ938_05470 [Microbacterium sp. cx-55]